MIKVNLNKFHTAIIPRLPFVNDISTTLLKNHCHSISFLDLLSLEVNLRKDELRRIWQYDANFKIGWLHDEVINSYFSVICKSQEKVLYCGTTEALLISHGKSFRRLWKSESIQKDSVTITPLTLLDIIGFLSKLTCVTDAIASLILSETILMKVAKHWEGTFCYKMHFTIVDTHCGRV